MERSTTAREALLAELIADVAKLIDRAEALLLSVDRSRDKLIEAARLLDERVALLERHLAATVLQSKAAAIQDLKRSTYEFAVASMQRQKDSMTEAIRQVVKKELQMPLSDYVTASQTRANLRRRWRPWLTHSVTVAAASAVTAMLMHLGGG